VISSNEFEAEIPLLPVVVTSLRSEGARGLNGGVRLHVEVEASDSAVLAGMPWACRQSGVFTSPAIWSRGSFVCTVSDTYHEGAMSLVSA